MTRWLVLCLATLASSAYAEDTTDAPEPPTTEERLARLEAGLQAERANRVLDADYRARAIRFGNDVDVDVIPAGDAAVTSVRRSWFPFVGDDPHDRLDRPDFYRLVGRDDLASRYERRRTIAFAGIAIGLAAGTFGGCMYYGSEGRAYQAAGLISIVGGLVSLGVGAYFIERMDTVSADAAHELAADYNRTLRQRLRVTPYASASSLGLGLSGAL